jgi:hypothetical protein
LLDAAKKCCHFEGPADKEEFKRDVLQVLRTIKQRYRRTITRNVNDDEDDEDEKESTDDTTINESTDYSD